MYVAISLCARNKKEILVKTVVNKIQNKAAYGNNAYNDWVI
jgi:hypothetical protein